MSSLVVAIALWCGQPDPGSMNYPEKNKVIDKCRKELFECTTKNSSGTGYIDCFKNKEIGR